jgi:hypothetical protein
LEKKLLSLKRRGKDRRKVDKPRNQENRNLDEKIAAFSPMVCC